MDFRQDERVELERLVHVELYLVKLKRPRVKIACNNDIVLSAKLFEHLIDVAAEYLVAQNHDIAAEIRVERDRVAASLKRNAGIQ